MPAVPWDPMARLEIKRQMGQVDIAAVSELLDVAAAVDGHNPLGEHQWLDLVHGNRHGLRRPGGLGAGPRPPRRLRPADPGGRRSEPTVMTTGRRGPWSTSSTPTTAWPATASARRWSATALDIVRQEGGGHVHLWVPKPTAAHDRLAAAVGLARGRELRQLRRALPVHEQATVDVRPFVPGQDEEAWLEVNNRAFSWHPEQGGWDLDTLRHREEQPWFDPAGFLLHERDGKLAAFCWTKVHHARPRAPRPRARPRPRRRLGEIYVVAVDPAFQRLGLGPAAGAGRPRLPGRAGASAPPCSTSTPTTRGRCACTSRWASPSTTSTGPTSATWQPVIRRRSRS